MYRDALSHLRSAITAGALLAVLLAILCARTARAQRIAPAGLPPEKDLTQFVYDEWTTADGLPHGTVNDLLQTRDGYLWVATEGGLTRFDGVSFTVFDKSNGQAPIEEALREAAPDGAEAVVERLRALARRHAGPSRPPDDDITLLVLATRAE